MPAPTLTPTGPRAIALVRLAELVAASATFRSVVGAVSAAAALNFIHCPHARERSETDDPDFVPPERPWAVITNDDSVGFEYRRGFKAIGALLLSFEFYTHPDYADNDFDQLIYFENRIGQIIAEMNALQNTPKTASAMYLKVNKFEQREPANEIDGKYFGDVPNFYSCSFNVYWG